MITQAIVFEGAEKTLVDAYNSIPKADQDHNYWTHDEVDPIRKAIKDFYLPQQGFRCCYCNMHYPTLHGRVWDVEHIVSQSSNPQFLFEPQNLAISCIDCNTAKSDQKVLRQIRVAYQRNSEAYIIIHPHFDIFENNISVKEGKIYLPRNQKGERTIYMCQLLRYAYKFGGWDGGLADSEELVEKFEDPMNAEGEPQMEAKVADILQSANI